MRGGTFLSVPKKCCTVQDEVLTSVADECGEAMRGICVSLSCQEMGETCTKIAMEGDPG